MNRPSLQLACLVFVVAMALRCDANRTPLAPDLGEPQTAAIQGAVLSGGSPLTGAEVALAGPGVTRKVISGTGGAFAFADLRPGLYTVTASFADVGCSSATAVVKAGETVTMGIDCTAAKPQTRATITGSVTAGGAPVGRAEVTLTGFAEVHAVVADTVGHFTFSELTSGPYEVWAAAPGFSCESRTVDIQAAQAATVNISCAVDDGGGGGGLPVPPMDGPGKIAFERVGRIMVVDPEGRNALTFIEGLAPSWSKDGTKFAFQRPGCPDRTMPPGAPCDDIWMVNANGSGLSPITEYEWVLDSDPVWSPDGSKVAFVRFVHGPDQNYLVVADVDPPTPLWSEVVPSAWWPRSRPTWSPDGARIAFTCEGSPPAWESDICVVASNRDGGYSGSQSFSGLAKITADNWTDSDPAWSPDGARIAFSTNRHASDGRTYIALINPDGSGFTRLVAGRLPAWSPDGTRIVFVRGADAPGLYVVNADGSGLARITNDPADTAPSWGR